MWFPNSDLYEKHGEKNVAPFFYILRKKYYEMSFFHRAVKGWNSIPKTLLAADSFKAFKGWGCQR